MDDVKSDLLQENPKLSDSPLNLFSKFATAISNQVDLLTRSVELNYLDVFLVNGCIGVEHVDERNNIVACSQQRQLVGLKPKCVRINGQKSAEHGYVHNVHSDINFDCLPGLRKIAHQAKSLEISILDDDTDSSLFLGNFPVNFTHVSVATLCKMSDILIRYVDRVISFGGVIYLNFIGELNGAIQCLDTVLLKLIEQNRWEEIFVQVQGAISEEVTFMDRLVRWWQRFAPLKRRELAVSFKSNLADFEFIRKLPQGTTLTERKMQRYHYMTHPREAMKEARFWKEADGMLHVLFT
ncbi:hypothetical protein L596_022538 [Steinernema carpocapsae]|uniref:Uncharacterized protein n=1 Tax=Steinernema carpocapsae TaxID=34508 RepID=A0A4U5MM17_STECR|nr:hypothetical protein L596_022538 [Steinernema carpocapsae]